MEDAGKYFVQCSRCGEKKFYLSRVEVDKLEGLNLSDFTLVCSYCGSVNEGEVKYGAQVKIE